MAPDHGDLIDNHDAQGLQRPFGVAATPRRLLNGEEPPNPNPESKESGQRPPFTEPLLTITISCGTQTWPQGILGSS